MLHGCLTSSTKYIVHAYFGRERAKQHLKKTEMREEWPLWDTEVNMKHYEERGTLYFFVLIGDRDQNLP